MSKDSIQEDLDASRGGDSRAHGQRATTEDLPETVSLVPPSTSRGSLGATSQASVVSPIGALQLDEIARSRVLSQVTLAMTPLVAVAILLFLGGDPVRKLVALFGLALLSGANVVLRFIARPDRYTERRVAVIWLVATAGLELVVFYFGPLSAAVIALAMGLYFVGLGNSRDVALSTYLVMALGHGVMVTLLALDVVEDQGVISSEALPTAYLVVVGVLLQGLFIAIYVLARLSRRTMLSSVMALTDAVRALGQRDLLLEEAKQDFARAMRLGGGGRFTGAILGRYELGEVVGRGAMGEVYRARNTETGAEVAVKVLLTEALRSPMALARFRREAALVSSLDSPHVATVYEVGPESDELPFLAMELLEGEDLGAILRQKPRLSPGEVVELARQVGRGLEVAAAAGIVHRDIKPQNLFRTVDGAWKILDFGVSKLVGSGSTLTEGQVVGTPAYMAPEQARGKEVDHRVDLYALGAIAYRCLTGRPPFSQRDLGALLYKVVHEMPLRPSTAARLDAGFDAVLAIALAKNPRDRFGSGAELADALDAAAGGRLDPAIESRGRALGKRWGEG